MRASSIVKWQFDGTPGPGLVLTGLIWWDNSQVLHHMQRVSLSWTFFLKKSSSVWQRNIWMHPNALQNNMVLYCIFGDPKGEWYFLLTSTNLMRKCIRNAPRPFCRTLFCWVASNMCYYNGFIQTPCCWQILYICTMLMQCGAPPPWTILNVVTNQLSQLWGTAL